MDINVILFGATGMIGQGVLIECLDHPAVKSLLVVGRRSCGVQHDTLQEIIHTDFMDYTAIEDQLTGYNACFFCLGISSTGMTEEAYHRITHDYAVQAAAVLAAHNPTMTFCYISGAGADATEKSRTMWARVKGKAENALKAFPFKNVYLMRPAFVHPVKGVTPSYTFYKVVGPLFPVLRFLFPAYVTTTAEVGQALINVVLYGSDKQTLENRDMIQQAQRTAS
jgi:uncharacterized protein YbjT (DUF2867 family)